MHIFKDIVKNRKLILYLSKNDFKTKYAGSYLGIIWAFVQPLVTVLLYWFVFGRLRPAGESEYPFILWLIAGLVPWFFFSEAVTMATNCFMEYSYLVKKVLFDIKVLPIVKVVSSLYVHAFFLMVLILLYIVYGMFPGIIVVQLLYYSFCLFMLVLSMVYLTSAIAVFFKDATQIINIAMQIGVWLTPIMWKFSDINLPSQLVTIFKLNPMFYIVDGYRGTLLEHRWFFETPRLTIYFWIFVLVMFIISRYVYVRLKPHFSDSL